MNRFFEYVVHHPFLVAAAAILAVLGIVIEFRHRARGSSAVAPADAVRLANLAGPFDGHLRMISAVSEGARALRLGSTRITPDWTSTTRVDLRHLFGTE